MFIVYQLYYNKAVKRKKIVSLGMKSHTCNPSTWKAETGRPGVPQQLRLQGKP